MQSWGKLLFLKTKAGIVQQAAEDVTSRADKKSAKGKFFFAFQSGPFACKSLPLKKGCLR
jgi:hypothetical protein